jgi:hypothetical protein
LAANNINPNPRAAQRRYQQSPKGRAARRRYQQGPNGTRLSVVNTVRKAARAPGVSASGSGDVNRNRQFSFLANLQRGFLLAYGPGQFPLGNFERIFSANCATRRSAAPRTQPGPRGSFQYRPPIATPYLLPPRLVVVHNKFVIVGADSCLEARHGPCSGPSPRHRRTPAADHRAWSGQNPKPSSRPWSSIRIVTTLARFRKP